MSENQPRTTFTAPVSGGDIHGWFRTTDNRELSPEQEDELARELSARTAEYAGPRAVWLTERDRTMARANGVALTVGELGVKFVIDNEYTIFPAPRDQQVPSPAGPTLRSSDLLQVA